MELDENAEYYGTFEGSNDVNRPKNPGFYVDANLTGTEKSTRTEDQIATLDTASWLIKNKSKYKDQIIIQRKRSRKYGNKFKSSS